MILLKTNKSSYVGQQHFIFCSFGKMFSPGFSVSNVSQLGAFDKQPFCTDPSVAIKEILKIKRLIVMTIGSLFSP